MSSTNKPQSLLGLAFLLFSSTFTLAQQHPISANQIQALTAERAYTSLNLFREYLALPNDASFPDDIEQVAVWLEQQFEQRGFELTRIETPGNPLLLAERTSSGTDKTVLVYLQADGQPVDPNAWDQENPYQPVMKSLDGTGAHWQAIPWPPADIDLWPDWRVFARSASDSKGPNIQFLAALDNLAEAGIEPDFNLKVIIDLEEELGSPNLPAAVIANRDLLAADMLLIFDGPPHASGKPTLVFGARGIATVTLTTYGPKVPQHSGHYGNYAPNPGFHLAHILSSLKAPDGRVRIGGFYDGVEISDEVRAILKQVPDDEAAIQKQLGFSQPDHVATTLQESLQYPSLNIRGLGSAWIGQQARTIIPDTATAEIDIRLVKESNPKHLLKLMRDHIIAQGYTVLDGPPTDQQRALHSRLASFNSKVNYAAYRTDFNSVPGRMATAALHHLHGSDPIRIRTSGGSIPISPFVETLDIPAVSVPTVNIDNNQHSPNENLRVGDFIDGISVITAVLAQPLVDID